MDMLHHDGARQEFTARFSDKRKENAVFIPFDIDFQRPDLTDAPVAANLRERFYSNGYFVVSLIGG
jgi:hypothetical protein